MNRDAFFTTLRAVFGPFTQEQVNGINALIAAAAPATKVDRLAYCLGTAWHETASTMQPIHEIGARSYFDKYEPGTKIGKALGNTIKGDGYRFRGRGYVQLTGRRNYALAGGKIGVDLLGSPDRALEPATAAKILYAGMEQGWFTSKDLDDYLDGIDEDDAEDLREFTAARRIVNGTDKAEKIGWYAIAFEKALRGAGWGATPIPPPPDIPAPEPAPEPVSWLAALIDFLFSLFKRK